MIGRRAFIAAGLFAGLASRARASQGSGGRRIEVVPLWEGQPPGGEGVTVRQRSVRRSPTSPPTDIAIYGVTRPTLTIVRPERPNGTSILMVPGGGYERVALASDGGAIAHHFADLGFTVGALLYRLAYDGWAAGPDAPLQDAQRAFRLLRRLAPGRVGVMGFSAGGHLAGSLATRFTERTYARPADEDAGSARPDFAGLFFPVVTMAEPHAHAQSRRNLIGADPSPDRIRRWSLEQNVREGAPPVFLAAAADDSVVPVENSLMLFEALQAAKVPAAMHIFDVGGHGFGSLSDPAGPGRHWPLLFRDWLGRQSAA